MPILYCTLCGKKISAPAAAIGKRGQCPRCQTWLSIPETDQSAPETKGDSPAPPSLPPMDNSSKADAPTPVFMEMPTLPESAQTLERFQSASRSAALPRRNRRSGFLLFAPGLALIAIGFGAQLWLEHLKLLQLMDDNEQGALTACLDYFNDQKIYARTRPQSEGPHYAQSLRYFSNWERANAEGNPGQAVPWNGYCFKTLGGQGEHVPGGRKSYVVNGRMIGGFALVAYPAAYGVTGRLTFMISNLGNLYFADLGPGTLKWVLNSTEFDPDVAWEVYEDSPGPVPELPTDFANPSQQDILRTTRNAQPQPSRPKTGVENDVTKASSSAQSLDPVVKAHRLAYLEECFTAITLPPQVFLSAELKAKLKSIDVRAPQLAELKSALEGRDWLGVYRELMGEPAEVPSGEQIDAALAKLRSKQIYLILKGVTAPTATWERPGVLWISIEVLNENRLSLGTRISFEKTPEGDGLIHPWQLSEGDPIVVYGLEKEVVDRLRKIQTEFEPKFAALTTREKLGEKASVLRNERLELKNEVRQVVVDTFCGNTEPKSAKEKAVEPNAAKEPTSTDADRGRSTNSQTKAKASGGPKAKSLLNMANQYIKAGSLEKACDYATKVMADFPDSLEAEDAKAILQVSK